MRLRSLGRHAREAGAAVTGLVVVVCLAVMVLLFVVVLPIAGRTQMSDQAEGGADAAALAAADRMRDVVLERFDTLAAGGDLAGLLPPSVGIAEAAEYADRNGGRLVSAAYSVDRGAGRVEVQVVRTNPPGSSRPEVRRNGTAEVGVVLAGCGIEDRRVIIGYEPVPTPTPTPTPTPEPGETPTPTPTPSPTPPPPPVPIWGSEHRFSCRASDGSTFRSDWDRSLAEARRDGRAWVEARLEPRLVRR